MGVAYRKDWFEDAAEKTAFKVRYGYELAVPDTWDQFRDVAEFFTRPGENKYGCVLPTGLVMRAMGKDLLRLKRQPGADSYWIVRQPPGPMPETMKDQF